MHGEGSERPIRTLTLRAAKGKKYASLAEWEITLKSAILALSKSPEEILADALAADDDQGENEDKEDEELVFAHDGDGEKPTDIEGEEDEMAALGPPLNGSQRPYPPGRGGDDQGEDGDANGIDAAPRKGSNPRKPLDSAKPIPPATPVVSSTAATDGEEEKRQLLSHTTSELALLTKVTDELRSADFAALFRAMSDESSSTPATTRTISRTQFVDAVAAFTTERNDISANLLFDSIAATSGSRFAPKCIAYRAAVAACSLATNTDTNVVTAIVFESHSESNAEDGSKILTLAELTKYLTVTLTYRLIFQSPPRTTVAVETDAHRKKFEDAHAMHATRSAPLAQAFARKTFNEMDLDHSHGISASEFESWLSDLAGTTAEEEDVVTPLPSFAGAT